MPGLWHQTRRFAATANFRRDQSKTGTPCVPVLLRCMSPQLGTLRPQVLRPVSDRCGRRRTHRIFGGARFCPPYRLFARKQGLPRVVPAHDELFAAGDTPIEYETDNAENRDAGERE